MSYTNQTQHYGLPQYVGTDVPAWLTDVNGAFATIDQGMNAAKTQADSAATAAGQAANDIVSINSTLGTQAGQISAAANAAAAAQTTANDADEKADTNTQSISEIDARVTALERGGGGGSDIEVVTVTIPTGSVYTDYTPPSGKIPICADVRTSGGAVGLGVMMLHTNAGVYRLVICGFDNLGPGSTAALHAAAWTAPVEVSVILTAI